MPDVLWGDLDRVSLASVLQMLELEGHHGRVTVEGGHLLLLDGSLVGGDYLTLQGVDAAVEALVRARGGFVVSDEMEESDLPAVGVPHAVLESCRLLDDLERFGTMVPEAGQRGDGPLAAVLAEADGARTLAALIAATGQTVVAVLPAFAGGVESGALRGRYGGASEDLQLLEVRGAAPAAVSPEPAPAAAAPDPADFDDLVFAARKLVRQRRFDDAIASLQRAHALRPDSRIVQQNLSRVLELRTRD